MALCSSPVLKLLDFTKPFVVELNALDVALDAVFLQNYEDRLHPVAYFSKKYIDAEKNYAPLYKKLFKIFKACQK